MSNGYPNPQSIVFRDFLVPGGDSDEAVLASIAEAPAPVIEVIRTTERDPYDEAPVELFGFGVTTAKAKKAGSKFSGTARKRAKLSIADAQVEPFEDLRDLLASLPKDDTMPNISTAETSDRIAVEKRNVRVRAFLYAASREKDNDYHVIIGRALNDPPRLFMNVEISGLPSANAPSFDTLKKVRDTYETFFKGKLPGEDYDFYQEWVTKKPIPVIIQGSLFFDSSHANDPNNKPGPQSAKPASIWEIHPVTRIIFNPEA